MSKFIEAEVGAEEEGLLFLSLEVHVCCHSVGQLDRAEEQEQKVLVEQFVRPSIELLGAAVVRMLAEAVLVEMELGHIVVAAAVVEDHL